MKILQNYWKWCVLEVLTLLWYISALTTPSGNGSLIGPWIPMQQNGCTGKQNLKECPHTEKERIFREHVCLHVSRHRKAIIQWQYHCQYKPDLGQFLEFMAPSHQCPKGHYGKVQKHQRYNAVRIYCESCPIGSYEPESTSSPLNLRGCHYKSHKLHPSDHMVLFINGTPSSPDVYNCNHSGGYYSDYHEMFCDFHKPCKCVRDAACPVCNGTRLELLPDGTCRSECASTRLPENRFACTDPKISGKAIEEIILNVETAHMVCKSDKSKGGNSSSVAAGVIVSIGVAIFVGVGVVIWNHRRHNSGTTHCCLICRCKKTFCH